ncbi:MAG: endonuclease [Candidatus Vogelbacteria bacterium CG10_big_fil_rev_8_21_14_0_10_51_16]|uniref:Endonuclease n=1 Tax=Candidatus Vogelbacteria bacterium CG10_big_fil_rev_8_21_14_0_10_51_16 TaxID=1975045 RepID=A0A2H0RDV7_9BACT|nr:MAG: endonuclease [Candidatus Vogelbacteria bacterium CG10_big_fil_rev_8_21_14_0_10_51_16]
MYFVYIIKSLKDGKFYTGLTTDVTKRLAEHNRGKDSTPSTKSRGPFTLVHVEELPVLRTARAREKYLKSGAGREWRDNNIP